MKNIVDSTATGLITDLASFNQLDQLALQWAQSLTRSRALNFSPSSRLAEYWRLTTNFLVSLVKNRGCARSHLALLCWHLQCTERVVLLMVPSTGSKQRPLSPAYKTVRVVSASLPAKHLPITTSKLPIRWAPLWHGLFCL